MAEKTDYTTKTDQELWDLLAEARESLRVIGFDAAMGKLTHVAGKTKLRRAVAQILTELNKRATVAA